MSNDYQQPMANGQDHPLKPVPPAILETARQVLREAAEAPYHDLSADMAEPLADSVVWALFEKGYLHSRCHDCGASLS